MKKDNTNNDDVKSRDAIAAIQKKLIGKGLTYKEIYSIMDEISKNKLGEILTTYFAASGYSEGFTGKELYYLTKAMVETGEKLTFKGIVADKHSIGGIPGTRTTLIVVPIIAAAGFKIPKSSSRAITSPGGTADDMEVLAPVTLSKKRIVEIVRKTNGCIVWGGSIGIAPADDVMINVEKPLFFESFDKILVSIMAKKIAFGSNHVVIDLPYGKTAKVHYKKDAQVLKTKFQDLAGEFGIKIKILIHRMNEPFGKGIGPILETKDALKVLQQKPDRPMDLEEKSIDLSSELLKLCLKDSSSSFKRNILGKYGNCENWTKEILKSGKAFEKMKEIIKAQGGNHEIDSDDLNPGKYSYEIEAKKSGSVTDVNILNISMLARLLGAPEQKGAGIYLNKKIGDTVKPEETIYTIYSQKMYNLKKGKASIDKFPIISIS